MRVQALPSVVLPSDISPGPYLLTEDGVVRAANGSIVCVMGDPSSPATPQNQRDALAVLALPLLLDACRCILAAKDQAALALPASSNITLNLAADLAGKALESMRRDLPAETPSSTAPLATGDRS